MSQYLLFVILFIGFVDYLGIGLVYPVFATLLFDTKQNLVPIEATAEYRGAMLGMLIALTPLTQFFSSPLLGAFSDLRGRKKTLILGITCGIIGYSLAVIGLMYSSLTLLFTYRILVGIADGTAAVSQAVLADISNEENKAARFGLFNASLGFGFTVGPFIGGILTDTSSWFGYAKPFILAGILCVINLLTVLYKFPETKAKDLKETFNVFEGIINISKVFVLKKLRWLFIGGFALSFAWSFFNEFFPLVLIERYQFTPHLIGNYYGWTGFWYALTAAVGTVPLLKRYSPDAIVRYSLLICAALITCFAFIPNSTYIWGITPFIMYTLALSHPTACSVVSNHTVPERQGEILGVYQSVGAAAYGLSPLFAGGMVGAMPEMTIWCSAAAILCSCIAFWYASETLKTSRNAV